MKKHEIVAIAGGLVLGLGGTGASYAQTIDVTPWLDQTYEVTNYPHSPNVPHVFDQSGFKLAKNPGGQIFFQLIDGYWWQGWRGDSPNGVHLKLVTQEPGKPRQIIEEGDLVDFDPALHIHWKADKTFVIHTAKTDPGKDSRHDLWVIPYNRLEPNNGKLAVYIVLDSAPSQDHSHELAGQAATRRTGPILLTHGGAHGNQR